MAKILMLEPKLHNKDDLYQGDEHGCLLGRGLDIAWSEIQVPGFRSLSIVNYI
jgi:hypothetical protein